MGHLGHLKAEYRDLVRRLDANQVGLPEPEDPRARAGWQEILEILYTPDEAALAARMPIMPASLEAVAQRVGIPAAALRPRLDAMADKGIVMDLVHPESGAVRYLLAPPVIGFFEFSMMRAKDMIPKKRMAEALDAYCSGDDAFVQDLFGGATVIGRTLVHEDTLGDALLPDVLDWERTTAIIAEARSIGVSYCYCRHKASHVPVNSIEKTVRMALERGRLPHLLFDEGASRGARFLNHVVRGICALPPVVRALASAQVRSRFVRYALARVADPTAPREKPHGEATYKV